MLLSGGACCAFSGFEAATVLPGKLGNFQTLLEKKRVFVAKPEIEPHCQLRLVSVTAALLLSIRAPDAQTTVVRPQSVYTVGRLVCL